MLTSVAYSLRMPPAFAEQSYAEKGWDLLNKMKYLQAQNLLKRSIEQDFSDANSYIAIVSNDPAGYVLRG